MQRTLLAAEDRLLTDATLHQGDIRVAATETSPWKVPGVRVSVKNSGLPLVDEDVKTREIFTQSKHPHQPLLRRIGRIQQVLLRTYTETFITLQINTSEELINSFLRPAREYYIEHNIVPAFAEVDLECMFPNIPRAKVTQPYDDLNTRYQKMRNIQRRSQDIRVSVARQKTGQLDCLGTKHRDHFHAHTYAEAGGIIGYDLHCNNLFVMGSEIWAQSTGVAIGGMLSAANADVVLTRLESTVAWPRHFPPTVELGRFRDNIFITCPQTEIHVWVPKIKSFLADLYHMPLKVESVGATATFLVCQMAVKGTEIQWSLKNKVLLSRPTQAPQVFRYVANHLPHAEWVVKGMAHGVGHKCVRVASSDDLRVQNFVHTVWEFKYNEYPARWWRPTLKLLYMKAGLHRTCAWEHMHTHLKWTCPPPADYVWLQMTCKPLLTISLAHDVPTRDMYDTHCMTTLKEFVAQYVQPAKPACTSAAVPPTHQQVDTPAPGTPKEHVRKQRSRTVWAPYAQRVTRSQTRAMGMSARHVATMQRGGTSPSVDTPTQSVETPGTDHTHIRACGIPGSTAQSATPEHIHEAPPGTTSRKPTTTPEVTTPAPSGVRDIQQATPSSTAQGDVIGGGTIEKMVQSVRARNGDQKRPLQRSAGRGTPRHTPHTPRPNDSAHDPRPHHAHEKASAQKHHAHDNPRHQHTIPRQWRPQDGTTGPAERHTR